MKIIICLSISMIWIINIYAQDWEIFTPTNTGLPSDNVLSMAADSLGNMWFGTKSGLSKFDGEVWTNYNKLNSSLPSEIIYSIAIDKSGNKWLGTNGGVVKFNDVECIVYNRSNSGLSCDTVLAIALDSLDNKWIGIAPKWDRNDGYIDGGLVKFNDTIWTRYTSSNSLLPSDYITSIAIEDSGIIWIGTCDGIAKLNGSNWTVFNAKNSNFPIDSISSIVIDQYNNKWIGFSKTLYGTGYCYGGAGFAKFDNQKWTFFHEDNSALPSNNIYSIAVDKFGNKWIGTTNGLVKYKGETWEIYNSSNSNLPGEKVNSISIDYYGNRWISILTDEWSGIGHYLGAGLAKINDTSLTFFSHSNTGLPYRWIHSIVIDSVENKWIGTYGNGLSKFDGEVWTNYYKSNSGLISDTINEIVIDTLGNLWIGTFNGLSKFDGEVWTNYNTSNSDIPSNIVYAIEIDKFGNKWIGTKDGLSKFDDINWTTFNINWISSIFIDNQDNIWIGTYGQGVYKYNNENWTNYTVFNSGLPTNWAIELVMDEKGNLWVGTDDRGLAKFNGDSWVTYNTTNSNIPGNDVMSIMIDKSGSKWVGTNNGFARICCANDTIYTFSIPELLYNCFYSIAIEVSGIIWLGTTYDGLVKFYDYPTINYPTSVTKNKLDNSLILYPNPVTDFLKIRNLFLDSEIKISDISGKLLLTKNTDSNAAILDIGNLPKGIYIINVCSPYGNKTGKIIKQ